MKSTSPSTPASTPAASQPGYSTPRSSEAQPSEQSPLRPFPPFYSVYGLTPCEWNPFDRERFPPHPSPSRGYVIFPSPTPVGDTNEYGYHMFPIPAHTPVTPTQLVFTSYYGEATTR